MNSFSLPTGFSFYYTGSALVEYELNKKNVFITQCSIYDGFLKQKKSIPDRINNEFSDYFIDHTKTLIFRYGLD